MRYLSRRPAAWMSRKPSRLEWFFRLDAEAVNYICSLLSPQDLARISRCSKTLNAEVSAYYRRALSIDSVLKPFFDDPIGFRTMQATTGTLISGSAALQLFARTTYPNADLDIYVEHRFAGEVVHFMLENGYLFQPRRIQDPDPAITVIKTAGNGAKTFGRYLGRGIQDVLDFKKGDKKVQLITAKRAPLDIILSYHSTCVMNIITHQRAYALFPRATFIDRCSLIISTTGSDQELARAKYVERGWNMLDYWSPAFATEYSPDFASSKRWVGDGATWTLNLAPSLPHLGEDTISTNAFALEYTDEEDIGPVVSYDFAHSSRLRHIYTVVDGEHSLFRKAWKYQATRPFQDGFMDHRFNESILFARQQPELSDPTSKFSDLSEDFTFTAGRHCHYFIDDLPTWH